MVEHSKSYESRPTELDNETSKEGGSPQIIQCGICGMNGHQSDKCLELTKEVIAIKGTGLGMQLREEGPTWARSLEFAYGSKMAWTLCVAQIADGLHATIGSSNDVDGVAT
ncbi:hypothetical protein E5676_scaffold1449G00090 [Cucumis melo var. makuwa]|uniref:Uncharacterized protein n=1 Tax=Cucumis melo var. makuwa TaxID=1194695 RepID=A0A5A7V196_CUCMM|nr:hypothetical protein E6C27_scaffold518G00650 [Cucumis melo var. makuwa]TYK29973.1 hypothetical protein E5676_scaffold1449G00090 [Cucumis melo var. makuwa]